MNKIAHTAELKSELLRLASECTPGVYRKDMAGKLRDLAVRLAGDKELLSAHEITRQPVGTIFWRVVREGVIEGEGPWVVVPSGTMPIFLLSERAGDEGDFRGEEPPSGQYVVVSRGKGKVTTKAVAQRTIQAWLRAEGSDYRRG